VTHSTVDLGSHFAFGDNWQSYARGIDEPKIHRAATDLARLLPGNELRGRSFLDVGCGSGIHALAALRLGAASVLGIDIDPQSVAATRQTLERHAPGEPWDVRAASILDTSPRDLGSFDVVYSWGVLHHTGDMWRAIACTAALVNPNGRLAIALYRQTRLCPLWKIEKRVYSRLAPWGQRRIQAAFISAYRLATRVRTGRPHVHDPVRGMDFRHDVHDWLGGYPYESVRPKDARAFMDRHGFDLEREFLVRQRLGIFGTGNDEFVFRRR
jgi:2-polyprenyl-6-hydroxyphenyl methylase/3-demethylubiquinone-9 3-methyltransferase